MNRIVAIRISCIFIPNYNEILFYKVNPSIVKNIIFFLKSLKAKQASLLRVKNNILWYVFGRKRCKFLFTLLIALNWVIVNRYCGVRLLSIHQQATLLFGHSIYHINGSICSKTIKFNLDIFHCYIYRLLSVGQHWLSPIYIGALRWCWTILYSSLLLSSVNTGKNLNWDLFSSVFYIRII